MNIVIELPPPEPGRRWIVEVERRSPLLVPARSRKPRQRKRRWWWSR